MLNLCIRQKWKIATYEDGKVKGIAVGKTKVRVEVKDQEDIFAEVEVEVIKPDAYKITYHLDGGTNHKDNPATYDGEKPIFLQPAIKDGFEFDGWYTSSDFTGAPVNMIFSGSSGNKELFAKLDTNL